LTSGLVNTTRMVGGSLGLAVMASIATTRGAALAASGADAATALTGGSQLALLFAAGSILGAIVIAWTVLPPDAVPEPRIAVDDSEDAPILDAA
jgi:hypothetical protein